MLVRTLGALALLASGSLANAAVTSVNLSNYHLAGTYALPGGIADEASSVTWNWDTNTLFTLGDEGDAIVQVSKTGQLISSMSLTGFLDTEGMTYVGNGKFVITEERRQQAFLLTYSAGGTIDKTAMQMAQLGPQLGDGGAGNVGIEGISYDPRTGTFVTVKEKTPQGVSSNTIDFTTGAVTASSLFTPSLGVADLSDVQVLSTVIGSGADADNLLIFSQETQRLLEVTRTGTVLSFFDLAGVGNAEGVTIDADGNIYIVGEDPTLYVLAPNAPVPLPAGVWLLVSGLGAFGALRRRSLSRPATEGLFS